MHIFSSLKWLSVSLCFDIHCLSAGMTCHSLKSSDLWNNYNMACAFLKCEKEDNYQWVVSVIAKLCNMVGKTPTTIVTNRELALMK